MESAREGDGTVAEKATEYLGDYGPTLPVQFFQSTSMEKHRSGRI